MSFFNKKPKQVDLALDSCYEYLKKMFDEASKPAISRCSPILGRLSASLESFKDAISKFSNVEKDPDDEFAGRMSVSFIKTQKPKYAETLYKAIQSLNESIEKVHYETKYEDLREVQRLYADFVSKVLSINANFKGVVMGYSDEMNLFKKPFASIEKALKDFEYELGKNEEVFKSYIALRDEISKMVGLKNELYNIITYADDNESQSKLSQEAKLEKAELEKKIAEINNKVSELERRYRSIQSEVELILKPLERAARKYDHSKTSGESLAKQISSPITELSDHDAYLNFISMLEVMRSRIKDNTIKIDNATQAIDQINDAINAGIDSAIAEARSINEQKYALEQQAKEYTNKLYEAQKKANSIESEAKRRNSMIERQTEIKMQIEDAKNTIMHMFNQYYNVNVRIID
jgi:chromosome segregation ATPase